jgi:CheY-like chemotaxis protein
LDTQYHKFATSNDKANTRQESLGTGNDKQCRAIILLLNDVEETRDGIERLLTADGYHVNAARNEEDAIRSAKRDNPALVLISLGGTQSDLVAVAARIRQRAELSDQLPIVLFCIVALAEGAEVEIEKSTFGTRPDNFNQLRSFVSRLLL